MTSRHILSVDDLDDVEVDSILATARATLEGCQPDLRSRFVVALAFFTSSLRTRVGFAVATARLGGSAVDVTEVRGGAEMSRGESVSDTLRTVGGMVDVLVVRTPESISALGKVTGVPCPVINAGDGSGEHPTQALIDLLAIEEECGPVDELRVGICGDLSMRAVRSLLKVMGRRPPAHLVLIAPAGRDEPGVALVGPLAGLVEQRDTGNFEGLDVLYLAGLPAGSGARAIPEQVRRGFSLNPDTAAVLPAHAVVLSPMPVVDEIAPELWADPRVRVFQQSDRGVAVRMACLERCLGGGDGR